MDLLNILVFKQYPKEQPENLLLPLKNYCRYTVNSPGFCNRAEYNIFQPSSSPKYFNRVRKLDILFWVWIVFIKFIFRQKWLIYDTKSYI